ncbi:kinase binding protein CGI-121-domain-containing protein [Chytridium lagenaria]|nr:kinase binding protein CGI-121-domain-containing protein [Chytridium lagenaria]
MEFIHSIPLPSLYARPLPPFSTPSSTNPTRNHDPDLQLPAMQCLLLRNVTNAEEVKAKIISGDKNIQTVLAAATRAYLSRHQSLMRTKSLYSEILFNLSPNNNISEAMKWFGLGKGVTDVLLLFDRDEFPAEEKLGKLLTTIKCSPVPITELESVSDWDMVKKIFKITTPPGKTTEANKQNKPSTADLEKEWLQSIVISSMALKGYT